MKEKTRYRTVIGRCTRHEITSRNNMKISPVATHCDFWEKCEDKTSIQKASIRKEITDMRIKLTQILEILESEE